MTALALTLMLSACGDDGKDAGSNKTNTATTKPATTPTPTPVARTYTYEKAANFTADRSFTGYDRVSGSLTGDKIKTVEYSSSEVGVTSYSTQGGKVTLPDSADLPGGGVYSMVQGNGTISAGTRVKFNSGDNHVSLGLPEELKAYSYFAYAEYSNATSYRVFLVGSPTNPAEINQPASLTYLAMVGEGNNAKSQAKPQALTLDLAKNIVSGTISVVGDDGTVSDFDLTGTIDASKHVIGTLKSKDNSVTGEFRGRPFGAGGKELAALVTIKRPDGTYWLSLLTGALKQ